MYLGSLPTAARILQDRLGRPTFDINGIHRGIHRYCNHHTGVGILRVAQDKVLLAADSRGQ